VNISMDFIRVSGVQTGVGSSRSRIAGRFTPRARRKALLLAARERDGFAFSRWSKPTLSSAARARRGRFAKRLPGHDSGSITLSNTLLSKSSFCPWNTRPRLRRR